MAKRAKQVKLRLVEAATGQPLKLGDVVFTSNGTRGILTGMQEPHKPESTGRVYVLLADMREPCAFYPSVIGAVWIGRTDQ